MGIFADNGGVAKNEPYITVPWKLCIGKHALQHIPGRAALDNALTALEVEMGSDPKSALLLILIHERFMALDSSPWKKYFEALPEPAAYDAFHTPLYWNPELLSELLGSEVLQVRECII